MSSIDIYGDFELPDETTDIEVVTNPVQVVSSCYDLFKGMIKHLPLEIPFWNSIVPHWFIITDLVDQVYEKAVKTFEDTKIELSEQQLNEVLDILRKKAKDHNGTGLFLSALINQISLDMLVIDNFPEIDVIGYKLKKDKTIVLQPNGIAHILGSYSEGNTINRGKVNHSQAWAINRGVHLNQGSISIHHGVCSKDGIFINQGQPSSDLYQGSLEEKGIHINQAKISSQGINAKSGLYINLDFCELQGPNAHGGTHINLGLLKHAQGENEYGRIPTKHNGIYINLNHWSKTRRKFGKDLSAPKTGNDIYFANELARKLSELHFLDDLKNKNPKEIISVLNKFDFKKFEQDIDDLVQRIKRNDVGIR